MLQFTNMVVSNKEDPMGTFRSLWEGEIFRGTVDSLGWEHEGIGGVTIFVIFKRFTKKSTEFLSQYKF